MPRFQLLISAIEFAATLAFAVSGLIEAARRRMDVVGVFAVAFITAFGGGTVRDVLLDRPVFWISDQTYLLVAFGTTVLVFFVVRGLKLPQRLFLIPDAIGLALFAITGTQVALDLNAPWLVASLLGVTTGVVGGVLRDVLCNEVPLIFVPGEPYASAAWAGALTLIGLQALGASPVIAAWSGMAVVLALRLIGIVFAIRLPTYSERE